MSYAHFRSSALCSFFLLVAAPLVSAGTLALSPGGTLDISGLNIVSVGDLTFSDGRIWIADGATGGLLYAVNVDGTLINTVDPSVIPGLTGGPDALCALGTTTLMAFSSFGQSAAGRMTWTTGQLEEAYVGAQQATGAEFSGSLFVASGTTAGAGSTLLKLDSHTGAILTTVPIPGLTARIVDLARDPFTGAMYALCEDDQLREIDLVTGAILSTQNLAPFLIGHTSIAGGMDFDNTGALLYIANGSGAGADSIVVLDRSFTAIVCGSQLGTFTCPCNNSGSFGRGCRNSSVGSSGALFTASGVPRTLADTFLLRVGSVPPGTTVLFFQGTTAIEPAVALGDGTLCVAGSVVRIAVKAAPSGTVVFPGVGEPLIHIQGQIPGTTTTRLYQGWYRDAGSFCTTAVFNLTNAISTEWRL